MFRNVHPIVLALSLGMPAGALRAQEAVIDRAAAVEACCASLGEVRENIDRIDAQIVALMAERGRFVAAAARFKPNAASVHDGARVERIIVRVRQLAADRQLPPAVAEATYRAMIEAFTDYEKTLVPAATPAP